MKHRILRTALSASAIVALGISPVISIAHGPSRGPAQSMPAPGPFADASARPVLSDEQARVGISPWGPSDEIGRLNLMSAKSQAAILGRVDGRKVYDLSVVYFIGMPSWQAVGDPRYQIWMTHTPHGTVWASTPHDS